MPQLVFMPWYDIVEQTTIGKYTFHSFNLAAPNLALANQHEAINAILRNYLLQPYSDFAAREGWNERPVRRFTIVRSSEAEFKMSDLRYLQFVLAIAGLADRDFTNSDLYLSAENFHIVAQNYTDPIEVPFAPSTVGRTKFGRRLVGYMNGLYREIRPSSAASQVILPNLDYRLKLDAPLAQALWKFAKGRLGLQKAWSQKIAPSLFSFYSANNDALETQSELIYSQSAIERLLLGGGHSEQNLVAAATKFLADNELTLESHPVTSREWHSIKYNEGENERSCASIFEAWLREITRIRNQYAHGNDEAQGQWIWTEFEHRLLSAFLFPLLLKVFIRNFEGEALYPITDNDLKKLIAFPKLLATGKYFEEDPATPGRTPWSKVISDSRWIQL